MNNLFSDSLIVFLKSIEIPIFVINSNLEILFSNNLAKAITHNSTLDILDEIVIINNKSYSAQQIKIENYTVVILSDTNLYTINNDKFVSLIKDIEYISNVSKNLLGSIKSEFLNPLSALKIGFNLLENITEEQLKEGNYLQMVVKSCEKSLTKLSRMVQMFLLLSELDSSLNKNYDNFMLYDSISLEYLHLFKNIKNFNIFSDKNYFSVILKELLDNAHKYKKSSVSVAYTKNDTEDIITIINDTAELSHIKLQLIKNIDSAKLYSDNVSNVGFGLSAVNKLCKSLDIEHEFQYKAEKVFNTIKIKSTNRKKIAQSNKILIIEDEYSIAQLIYYFIQTISKNIEPVILEDLDDYETVIQQEKFLCICTDINLDKTYSGDDILLASKHSLLNKDTPVIAITAYAKYGDTENYKTKGYSDLILKPFEFKDLKDVLHKYVENIIII